jgi:hypothetical protein
MRAQLLARAELEVLAPGFGRRNVPGRQVERIAGLEDLLVVREAKGQPALEDISPVRALAAVVGQAPEERGRVDVLAKGHEVDRVAVQVLVPILHRAMLLDLRGALLRYLRHDSRLPRSI